MIGRMGRLSRSGLVCVAALVVFCAGCHSIAHVKEEEIVYSMLPRELEKQTLTDYLIEPPDILLIDALAVIPKPPYRVAAGDVLAVQVPNAFETDPIAGTYAVEPEGTVNLGVSYGSVSVVGKTLTEVRAAIVRHLVGKEILKDPRVVVSLVQSRGLQQIRGQHLVTPDGSVRLGLYGSVKIAGMTVNQARAAIEAHLSQYLLNPEISLDVAAYNSKLYYVIFDLAGSGQQIVRLPVTGNDTVLDAIAQAGGLTAASSEHQIWVARPAPADAECDQILPVDWCGITTRGRTATNYQLMPGDRVYVKGNPLIRADTFLARVISPIERVFGIILLGNTTIRSITPTMTNGVGIVTTNNNGNLVGTQ